LREIAYFLKELKCRLAPSSGTPALDAQVLLAHVVGQKRAWVLAHPEHTLSTPQEQALLAAVDRMEAGEPLPYVIGHWEFYGRDFKLSSAVLIPRPETELLVEQGLAWLKAHPASRRAIDVGVGSGCIAVTLAAEIPDLQVVACDISWPALQVAQHNLLKHGTGRRVYLLQSDLMSALAGPFDLVCANLPYIPTPLLADLPVSRSEPVLALDGGPDGLDGFRRLLPAIPARLSPGGLVLLEIEASQGEALGALAQECLPAGRIQILPDLTGRERLFCYQLQP
jgi:release factor glutamine methyltransferase